MARVRVRVRVRVKTRVRVRVRVRVRARVRVLIRLASGSSSGCSATSRPCTSCDEEARGDNYETPRVSLTMQPEPQPRT